MSTFPLKPTHKPVKAYYEALHQFQLHGHTTEGNTRAAFSDLLKKCCPPYGWHLVEEYAFKGTNKQPLRADGALVDDLTLVHGLWEAKDSSDASPVRNQEEGCRRIPAHQHPVPVARPRRPLPEDNRIAFDDSSKTGA